MCKGIESSFGDIGGEFGRDTDESAGASISMTVKIVWKTGWQIEPFDGCDG